MGVPSLGWEDPQEQGMATHSSILTWRISWTGEPGRLQSTGSQGVGHEWSDLAQHSMWLLLDDIDLNEEKFWREEAGVNTGL